MRCTHTRIRKNTLAEIRKALPDMEKDSDRLEYVYHTSAVRFDNILGTEFEFKNLLKRRKK